MTHPIYLNNNPLIGHITYMCPECGEELHKNQRCPHYRGPSIGNGRITASGKKAIGLDLIEEDMLRQYAISTAVCPE